jgi:hypothetical protein
VPLRGDEWRKSTVLIFLGKDQICRSSVLQRSECMVWKSEYMNLFPLN